LQRRIDGYRVLVSRAFSDSGRIELIRTSGELFDSMTGGAFGAHVRPVDKARALAAQSHASDLIMAVRTAFHGAVAFRSTVGRGLDALAPQEEDEESID
jgi:hypothetical protein